MRIKSLAVPPQARPVQRVEKIPLHVREIFSRDGMARHQDEFHRPGQFVLVLPETFPEQAPGAAALDGPADFAAGDDAQAGRGAFGQRVPVGDEAAGGQPLTLLPEPREIPVVRQPRTTAQSQAPAFRRRMSGVWG